MELLRGIGELFGGKKKKDATSAPGPVTRSSESWADEFGGVTEGQRKAADAAAKIVSEIQGHGPTRRAADNIRKAPFIEE